MLVTYGQAPAGGVWPRLEGPRRPGWEWSDRGGLGWGLWRTPSSLSSPLSFILFLPVFSSPHPRLESMFTARLFGDWGDWHRLISRTYIQSILELVQLKNLCWLRRYGNYLSNRPQVFTVYRLINHAGCWRNTPKNSSSVLPTSQVVY